GEDRSRGPPAGWWRSLPARPGRTDRPSRLHGGGPPAGSRWTGISVASGSRPWRPAGCTVKGRLALAFGSMRITFMSSTRGSRPQPHRREVLKGATAVGLATVLHPLALAEAQPTPARRDLIRAENEKAGTTDWLLKTSRVDPKTKYRCPWIEGYC